MSFTPSQITHARNLLDNPEKLHNKPAQRLWALEAVQYDSRRMKSKPSLPRNVIAFPSLIQRAIRKRSRTPHPAPTDGTAA